MGNEDIGKVCEIECDEILYKAVNEGAPESPVVKKFLCNWRVINTKTNETWSLRFSETKEHEKVQKAFYDKYGIDNFSHEG